MHAVSKIIGVAVFALALVLTALVIYLSRDLPDDDVSDFAVPAAGLKFAFGSGYPEQNIMQVDGFADGYALLSSGPVTVDAAQLQTLQYTWEPSGQTSELAFFWRQKGNSSEVKRAEITATGTVLFDLSSQADWAGEIVEFGLLVAGDARHPVAIGQLVLMPTDLKTRFALVWQGWTTYELRSQQSINFLQGGAHNQLVSLPLLVISWLLITLVLLRALSNSLGINPAGNRLIYVTGALFICAWMLLDIRWTVNSFRSAVEPLSSAIKTGENTYSRNDIDGEIHQYIQRLNTEVIRPNETNKTNRILLIGDENTIDYYLLRAKYHLLPNSANVAGQFEKNLSPETLDYVIYFGQPNAIANIPGWNADWRNALREVDRSQLGVVYQITH